MATQQRIIHFAGRVQGVGFRYVTCRVAAGHDVSGYVRNLPDGRVECVAEGEAGEIDAFVAELRQAMGRYIRQATQQVAEHTGGFAGFTVRYG